MSAASGWATWTFSSSFASSSRVTRPSPEWKPKSGRELLPHLVGEVVALVADRLFDFDRVDEAQTAAQVEAGRDAEGDPVS